jgi:hypothetical protein
MCKLKVEDNQPFTAQSSFIVRHQLSGASCGSMGVRTGFAEYSLAFSFA